MDRLRCRTRFGIGNGSSGHHEIAFQQSRGYGIQERIRIESRVIERAMDFQNVMVPAIPQ